MTTVPWRCAICGHEVPSLRDPMMPPVLTGRVRICRQCRRVVCGKHSVRLGTEVECVECRRSLDP